MRDAQNDGYEQALAQLVPDLQTRLASFKERVKSDPGIQIEHSGGAGGHHGAADAPAFRAMGMPAERLVGSRRFAAILAGGAALVSLGLLACVPALIEYRGASGLAMLVAVLAGMLLWHRQSRLRWLIAFFALGLAIKTADDAYKHALALVRLPMDVTVRWQAHLLGTLLGLALPIFCPTVGYVHPLKNLLYSCKSIAAIQVNNYFTVEIFNNFSVSCSVCTESRFKFLLS